MEAGAAFNLIPTLTLSFLKHNSEEFVLHLKHMADVETVNGLTVEEFKRSNIYSFNGLFGITVIHWLRLIYNSWSLFYSKKKKINPTQYLLLKTEIHFNNDDNGLLMSIFMYNKMKVNKNFKKHDNIFKILKIKMQILTTHFISREYNANWGHRKCHYNMFS